MNDLVDLGWSKNYFWGTLVVRNFKHICGDGYHGGTSLWVLVLSRLLAFHEFWVRILESRPIAWWHVQQVSNSVIQSTVSFINFRKLNDQLVLIFLECLKRFFPFVLGHCKRNKEKSFRTLLNLIKVNFSRAMLA